MQFQLVANFSQEQVTPKISTAEVLVAGLLKKEQLRRFFEEYEGSKAAVENCLNTFSENIVQVVTDCNGKLLKMQKAEQYEQFLRQMSFLNQK